MGRERRKDVERTKPDIVKATKTMLAPLYPPTSRVPCHSAETNNSMASETLQIT